LLLNSYRAFHRFGQAKIPGGGSVLGSSQFLALPQLPPKMMLSLKKVKIDWKISNFIEKIEDLNYRAVYAKNQEEMVITNHNMAVDSNWS